MQKQVKCRLSAGHGLEQRIGFPSVVKTSSLCKTSHTVFAKRRMGRLSRLSLTPLGATLCTSHQPSVHYNQVRYSVLSDRFVETSSASEPSYSYTRIMTFIAQHVPFAHARRRQWVELDSVTKRRCDCLRYSSISEVG